MLPGRTRIDREENASATVEFALVIPLLFFLFFATLDLFRILLAEEQLNLIAKDLAYHYKYDSLNSDNSAVAPDDLAETARDLASFANFFLIDENSLSASSVVFDEFQDFTLDFGGGESGDPAGSGSIFIFRLESSLNLSSPLTMLAFGGQEVSVHATTVSKHVP